MFGAAGSAKLAHAAGLHGIQLLAVLAILADAGRLPSRRAATMLALASLGYAAAFGAVTATAYAGRAPYDATAPWWIVLAAGVLTTGAAAVLVLAQASPARRTPAPGPPTRKTPFAGRTGR
ncbi:hypothetical protein F9278_43950 [Streptomyces phaeolivaceus]|uniref:DUF423 domain-containing protein n=1 Tax=Streptomyces phaeolivaceus TaxID=2653200 RepID=A0A5P8KJ42_9ACTN|nr:hypothetical protein F9278_43950 [Streptomyces phaeolivaceus]